MPQTYHAPFGQREQVLTIIVIIVFIGLAMLAKLLTADLDSNPELRFAAKVFAVIIIVLLALKWGLAVRAYEIKPYGIMVSKLLDKKVIRFEDIGSITLDYEFDVSRIDKNIINRGYFGYTTRCRDLNTEREIIFLTNRLSPVVTVNTPDRIYILSPEKSHDFVRDVKSRINCP